MPEVFKTIVIPVDFTANTDLALSKVLELVNTGEVVIHLIHAFKFGILANRLNKQERKAALVRADAKLNECKESIEDDLPSAKVFCWVIPSKSVQHTIVKKACELSADLIVISKKSNHSLFPFFNTVIPSQIARASGCAVLTVKPGALHNKIKNVVVLVAEGLPRQKMEVLEALCKKNRIKIFLITFADKVSSMGTAASELLRLYQWLKASNHCQVEYAVLPGHKKATTILHYAELNDADVLLLNLEAVSKSDWSGKHICDALSPTSRVQVLTIGTN
jgi:nucleotide-binding universal stress UspA family protein